MNYVKSQSCDVILTFIVLLVTIGGAHSFLFDSVVNNGISIAAFNVKHFGKSYMEGTTEVARLVKIMDLFDVVLVQEVRDSSTVSLINLKQNLISQTGHSWDYVVSQPLGRSKYYKEQYAYFYKTTSVTLIKTHQVDDSAQDAYEREPFCAEFAYNVPTSRNQKRIVLLGLHVRPAEALEELKEIPNTVKTVSSMFQDSQGVIALGDFNADCSYLSEPSRDTLEIFNGPDFRSLIPDSSDTTTKHSTDCAYDRIVVYGRSIDARNASVLNFQTWLHLSEAQALEVSDHYPVYFTLG